MQPQTGDNGANLLHRLLRLLRERAKLKALGAEGWTSAWFLSAAPFILFVVVRLHAPKYFPEVEDSAALTPALVYGFGSLLIASDFIFRMVDFKV